MCQGRSASIEGGRVATHRELADPSLHAPLSGDTIRALSAAGLALSGVIAAGHGLLAICFLFGVTPEWLLSHVAALGLPAPADRPLRKAAGRSPWTPEQVQ